MCSRKSESSRCQIPEVQESWVGLNVSPRGQGYEIRRRDEIRDADACERYNQHPSIKNF